MFPEKKKIVEHHFFPRTTAAVKHWQEVSSTARSSLVNTHFLQVLASILQLSVLPLSAFSYLVFSLVSFQTSQVSVLEILAFSL